MTAGPVRGREAMIAGMAPVLDDRPWCFVTGADPALAAQALGSFAEDEGLSLILPEPVARAHGLDVSRPMRRITLSVSSALDGVGLTAAVAGALAEAGIACNMVAAFHHDHVFVPAADAERAVRILQARARAEADAEGAASAGAEAGRGPEVGAEAGQGPVGGTGAGGGTPARAEAGQGRGAR